MLHKNGITQLTTKQSQDKKVTISGNKLTIGTTSGDIWPDTEHKSKVPHVLFYDIQQVLVINFIIYYMSNFLKFKMHFYSFCSMFVCLRNYCKIILWENTFCLWVIKGLERINWWINFYIF